jgi:hypothetical protein
MGKIGWAYRRARRAVTVLLVPLSVATHARAQGSDTVTAEALFQEGRDLLREGKVDAACPKLAESYRLDAATGTLIALAMCHEQEGKLASAWAEYVHAASRAKNEGRADRADGARQKAAALKPRLSTLVVEVPEAVASVPSLEIRRDGVVVGRATWNTVIPLDGGRHELEATAPGKRAFRTTIEVKRESDTARVRVPPLEDAGGAAAATPTLVAQNQPTPPPDTASDSGSKGLGALEWAGIGTAAAGVVAWGVGGYFLATALGEKEDSKSDCDGNVCGDSGFAKQEDMVAHGNLATIFGIGGTVLVGVGATLYFVGSAGDDVPQTSRLGVTLSPRPGGAWAGVKGAF